MTGVSILPAWRPEDAPVRDAYWPHRSAWQAELDEEIEDILGLAGLHDIVDPEG